MTDPVQPIAQAATSTADWQSQDQQAKSAPTPAPKPQAATPKPQVQEEPLRLVVEPMGGAAGYTYKLFDRVTGQLLFELPRETAAEMSADPNYSAGQIYSAKA